MLLRVDQVRPGHRIRGARVVWTRPLPDYTSWCIAVEPSNGTPVEASVHWHRPDDLVEVDDGSAVVRDRQSA